jgi:diadenosine tetraphosphate (Ap4A) HIT family hydrolase
MRTILYESQYYSVIVPNKPLIDRLDGGHVMIYPKTPVKDRTLLSPAQAIELMKLSMIVGEAMETGLNKRGIDVVRINYQDMGNWGFGTDTGPILHLHIFGRAASSQHQKHGEALYLPRTIKGFYDHARPLDKEDVEAIREEMNRLLQTDKYKHFCSN